MMSMLLVILFGGLDTVASTLGFVANFMAGSPAHRRQLIEDPALVDNAVEELMRRFPPSATARTLTRDYEYKGLHFKQGDKVYITALMSGLDDRRYPNAWEIDFRRQDAAQHNSFRCRPASLPGLAAGEAGDQAVPARSGWHVFRISRSSQANPSSTAPVRSIASNGWY